MLGGPFDVAAEALVHDGRGGPLAHLGHARLGAAPRAGFGDQGAGVLLQAVQYRLVLVTELQVHLRSPRHDAPDPGVEGDAADGPHAPLARALRKGLVDPVGELDERVPRVAPERHRGGAGVVLLALERDREVARADDAGHRADPLALVLEPRPLLDVRFGVAGISTRIAPLDRYSFEPGRAKGVAERRPVVIGGIADRTGGRQLAAERLAPEAGGEPAFLVDPRGDVDREVLRLLALGEGARHLESVDDPHRPVQPAAPRLGVGVGADEKGRAGIARAAEYGPDPVDAGVEARLLHARAQPAARLDVDRAQRLAHDPDAARAEPAEAPEIAEEAVRVDGDVDGVRWGSHLRSCIVMQRNPLCRRFVPCQLRGVRRPGRDRER